VLLGVAAPSVALPRTAGSEGVSVTRYVDDYGAVGDGVADDTRAIQEAVSAGYNGIWHNAVRVVFGAGKTYRVSRQIVLWAGVHLDTDARNPATILLAAHTPGFADPLHVKHVFMSRLSAARPDCKDNPSPFPEDPNYYYGRPGAPPFPGWPWRWPEDYDTAQYDQYKVHPGYGPGNNFWSQIRNLKFRVEPGNPGAGVIHYLNAQGSYLYNLEFDLADAQYAIASGPIIVNCTFRGGRWAVYDPPMMEFGMVVNSRFQGQKEAAYYQAVPAVRSWFGTIFENVPVAMRLSQPRALVMIGCEVRRAVVGVSLDSASTRVLIQNLKAVRTETLYRSPRTTLAGRPEGTVTLPTFVQGDVVDEGRWVEGGGVFPTNTHLPLESSVPAGFDLSRAANVKNFGAVGDGEADDTEALRRAIAAREIVYLPAGEYRLTDTVMLRRNTKLVGEHVLACNLVLKPNTPGFGDPSNPRPLLDTPDDPSGDVHLTQFSMHMGAWGGLAGNPGSIGLRWRVGRRSSVANCNLHAGAIPILVTGSGGGTFFNVWTAVSGLTKGFVVDHNREPLFVYSLSSEHQTDKALQLVGARDVYLYMVGGGEGDYPAEKTMNEFADSDRVAWIYTLVHPTDDAVDPEQMTALRIRNCPNVWIGPLVRVHEEPLLHTLLDLRPDGTVVDCDNRNFTLYRWGELNDLGRSGAAEYLAWSAVEPASWLARRVASVADLKPWLEGTLRPGGGARGAAWLELPARKGKVTLPAGRGGYACAHVYVMNPVAQRVRLACSSTAPLRCWLDGRELELEAHGSSYRCDVELRQGWRSLLFLVDDRGGGTTISTRITTATGQPAGVVFRATPPPVSSPISPAATAAGGTVRLSWRLPTDFGVDRIRVIRNDQRYPTGPQDGKVVYEGTGEACEDSTGRSHGALYYGFYTVDRSGAVSSGLVQRVDLGTAPFITSWLVCGPFDAPSVTDSGYSTAYFDEASVAPRPGDSSGGRTWQKLNPDEVIGDAVNLLSHYAKEGVIPHYKVAYLHTYIHAARKVTCMLLLGVDDGYKVWLNGKLVAGEDRQGVAVADNFAIPVELEAGWNRLLVKVTQGTGDWKLLARLAEPDGSLLSVPLKTSLVPEALPD